MVQCFLPAPIDTVVPGVPTSATERALPLECGDLSPLSRGDWSPSNRGNRASETGASTARASASTRACPGAHGGLTATSRLRKSGDKSPHSKPPRHENLVPSLPSDSGSQNGWGIVPASISVSVFIRVHPCLSVVKKSVTTSRPADRRPAGQRENPGAGKSRGPRPRRARRRCAAARRRASTTRRSPPQKMSLRLCRRLKAQRSPHAERPAVNQSTSTRLAPGCSRNSCRCT